jgi:hypothetical protein
MAATPALDLSNMVLQLLMMPAAAAAAAAAMDHMAMIASAGCMQTTSMRETAGVHPTHTVTSQLLL